MRFSTWLDAEWRPALGCTEPASLAWAVALAAQQAKGPVASVEVTCDPRLYKNCHAVGIPHSGRKVGILWAAALGAGLPDPSAGLECFRGIDDQALADAQALLEAGVVSVRVEPSRDRLWIEATVRGRDGEGRARIEGGHTNVTGLWRDGVPLPAEGGAADADAGETRRRVAAMSFADLIDLARSLTAADRDALRRGAERNVAIARHGLSLFPNRFVDAAAQDSLTRLSRLVCSGVYARMCGEDFVVMSLAGSGNKGIVCSVPLALWGREAGFDPDRVDEALALACLVTSSTTHHLGTLSAVCGCSNAAGIGLAAGLVLLEGGGPAEISLAVGNMVGNVAGMICDGAKIGCALKTMTSVDAAFRSASLALSGIGIPASDGIVGTDGTASLQNLGRIATRGMAAMDGEILAILAEKLAVAPAVGGPSAV